MYRAILQVQWKSGAAALLVMTLFAFMMPIAQVVLTGVASMAGATENAIQMLALQEGIGMGYPMIALFAGGLLGALCWQDDFTGKHVYALSLPVPRWYYLVLRMGAGLTLLAAPVFALWLAALLAAAQVDLPFGLHAYPTGLAVRFALISAIAFLTFYGLGSAAERTRKVLLWAIVVLFAVMALVTIAGYDRLVLSVVQRLLEWPSITDTFAGRWRLIDV